MEEMPTGYWANFSKFIVSLLKAWYGDAATPDNDFGFSWVPRVDGDYSQLAYFDRMSKGGVKGYFLAGQNPAGGGPNANVHRAGLRNLEWLVVLDWFETESATLLEERPECAAALRDRDRGLLHPRGSRSGEGGQLNPDAAAGPMAQESHRSVRRLPFPTPGFSTTWVSASSSSTPAPPIPGIRGC